MPNYELNRNCERERCDQARDPDQCQPGEEDGLQQGPPRPGALQAVSELARRESPAHVHGSHRLARVRREGRTGAPSGRNPPPSSKPASYDRGDQPDIKPRLRPCGRLLVYKDVEDSLLCHISKPQLLKCKWRRDMTKNVCVPL